MKQIKIHPGIIALACVAALPSCQEYEERDFWMTDYRMTPRLATAQPRQAVALPQVALNGVSPYAASDLPQQHESFRSRQDYRLTFHTWKNDALLRGPGRKRLVIDLSSQRGVCLVDEQVAMDFPVCTGTPSHRTPTGRFHISEKDANHWSNIYHCPMPYFMRLTSGGIGLHVGDVYRTPSSHGCIRTTRDACIALFEALPSGTEVTITP